MTLPNFTITGTFTPGPEWDAFWKMCEDHAEAEVTRALEQSRLSGLEVVMCYPGEEWRPVLMWPSREPVCWEHAETKERRVRP
jgi:hypothetical protein